MLAICLHRASRRPSKSYASLNVRERVQTARRMNLSPPVSWPAPIAAAWCFKLSALFALDAFAGGFVVQSIVAYWFHIRFGVEPAVLGASSSGPTSWRASRR